MIRKAGCECIIPSFCGKVGDSYCRVGSNGDAPEHPGRYRNILADPEVAIRAGAAKMKARARSAVSAERTPTDAEQAGGECRTSGKEAEVTASTYVYHRISASPRRWHAVADELAQRRKDLARSGGALYGLWRNQIGRPRDEVTAMTVWSVPVGAAEAEAALIGPTAEVRAVASQAMVPTLRPVDTQPPERQGNYAFRWFVTPEADWPEFLDLCARAWPGFEAAYDSQVVGLWRCSGNSTGAQRVDTIEGVDAGSVSSLLLTRRPDLAMWERSKLPQGPDETAVRDALSRRYDLCTSTVVYTTTLLTAVDVPDRARWA
jgi:hypothetical protein